MKDIKKGLKKKLNMRL